MLLPRRWIRQLTYVAGFLVFALFLVLVANKNRIIHLDHFISGDLVPQFFQPPSDAYVVDISIGSCSFLNIKSPTCGEPDKSLGLYGDVPEGQWTKVDKDLLLGRLWVSKRHLYSKLIKPDFFDTQKNPRTVHLVWVGTKKDCTIKGNKDCIPEEVIRDYMKTHPFDDDGYKYYLDVNKDEKLHVDTDKSKSAHKYNEDYKLKQGEKLSEKDDSDTPKEAEDLKDSTVEDLKEVPESKLDQDQDQYETEPENNDQVYGDEVPDDVATEMANQVANEKRNGAEKHLVRRQKETSRHKLKDYMSIPTLKKLNEAGWESRGNGIWVKYGPPGSLSVTGIDVLYGTDAKDPRPNWNLLPNPILDTGAAPHLLPRLSFRVGPRMDYKSSFKKDLKFRKDGTFKILQVADLHFSTGVGKCRDPVPIESQEGCEADPRTLKFIETVLEIENPDFVVMTGDQVFGQAAPDPETALFKAVLPFVKRKIPYAITLGNHDDESNLSREQMMQLASSLPYSVASVGPDAVDGYGNYAVTVDGSKNRGVSAAFYFLDSHSRSKQPKTNPGYDWFKESQIAWVGMEAESLLAHKNKKELLSMAFFHIPIPEYRQTENRPMLGQLREGVTAPLFHSDMRSAFSQAGIQVATVGHDHANDYCLLNPDTENSEFKHNMWLCYGGAVGEGGYGGYNEYIRRMRVYNLNELGWSIDTWKRAENNPGELFEKQRVVEAGSAVDHV
ncbi:CIC11C00000005977 [Sungouiella intermedia]|uniref:CIC11C00000005977 n=1 Tax=Sungouiella intermedia TaxID=45354 RepID=A0A1L0D5I1_9ASCO|nr:CIC11C00000005977 [[Candida] intermedia]